MNRLLCTAVLLLAIGTVRGEPPPGVKTIPVVLHPAVSPSPALGYPLLPELRHQKPGNAVPFYRMAALSRKEAIAALDDNLWYERVGRWREAPLDKLPRASVRTFLRPFDTALRGVEEGAFGTSIRRLGPDRQAPQTGHRHTAARHSRVARVGRRAFAPRSPGADRWPTGRHRPRSANAVLGTSAALAQRPRWLPPSSLSPSAAWQLWSWMI